MESSVKAERIGVGRTDCVAGSSMRKGYFERDQTSEKRWNDGRRKEGRRSGNTSKLSPAATVVLDSYTLRTPCFNTDEIEAREGVVRQSSGICLQQTRVGEVPIHV